MKCDKCGVWYVTSQHQRFGSHTCAKDMPPTMDEMLIKAMTLLEEMNETLNCIKANTDGM
jgi:hypothetical protein